MSDLPVELTALLDRAQAEQGPVVVLTGAGISADSGVPTFRGEEGYWTVGSTNYHPTEMATHEAFMRMPEEVWRWYLYRRSVCRAAEPNVAHHALVRLEHALRDRFVLITQNVDGLHLRAGAHLDRTYQIHGNIDYLRCEDEFPERVRPIPEDIPIDWPKDRAMDERTRDSLKCCQRGGFSRPHVLWFDEVYDETLFRFESSIRAATSASMLIVVGTSGNTNLPIQVGQIVASRGAAMIVINRDPSPFTEFASESANGYFAQGTSSDWVPRIVDHLV